jgi:glyoxylase-like metal-dependent hydrolase (beta-lactamase superfamily II)
MSIRARLSIAAVFALAISACGPGAQPSGPAMTISPAPTVAPTPRPLPPPAPAPPAEQRGKLYEFTSDDKGFDTHSFYYDTGHEVVVFDAQFTEGYAEDLLADIKKHTASEIRYVVVTHPNPDKFNGVGPFQRAGAKVVSSFATALAIPGVHAYKKAYFIGAGAFTEETYPPEAKVDITFADDFSLPLSGGARVELSRLSHAGVASTQTVAYIPAIEALIVGDLVHNKAHAWLEGGIVDGKPAPDLASWQSALDELNAYPEATVYGGRGQAAKVKDAIAEEQAYLAKMEQIVTEYVATVKDKSELSGPKAAEHHQKIADLATAAYPDYTLSYMITYGVYGLVSQIAAEVK